MTIETSPPMHTQLKVQPRARLHAQLQARATALVPVLRERAVESDRLRKMPEDTITDYAAAGFFTAMLPESLGGAAIDLCTFSDIVRTLARGDASAGWIGAFLMSHGWLLSRYGGEARADFFAGRPYALAAAAANPPGAAEPAEEGYRVSGRWRFGSGVMHAEWVLLSAMSPDGPLSLAVPVADIEVVDTWHVPGMRGTGSNDIVAEGVFVPGHRAIDFALYSSDRAPGAVLDPDYALLRYPMTRVLALIHAAVALGTADAALELFAANVGKRLRPQTRGMVMDEPLVRSAYAKAYDLVNIAGLQLRDAIARTDEVYAVEHQRNATLEDRAHINLGVTGAGAKAFEAVDLVVRASGASIHRTGDPLDRICRDSQVMRNHGAVDFESMSAVAGGVLLGAGLGDYADPMF